MGYSFEKDEHIEIYRVPNKTDEGNGDIFLKVVVSIAVTVPLTLNLLSPDVTADIQFTAQPRTQTSPLPSQNPPALTNPSPIDNSESNPSFIPTSLNRVRISHCNGLSIEGANFRAGPSRATTVIKGVIPVGESVFLTGSTTYGDGLYWYEAINESPLMPSMMPNAQNQIEANQRGWISACFV